MCKANWKKEFKLPWREAGPPNHDDDKVDSDQWVVNKELSLWDRGGVADLQGLLLLLRARPPENLWGLGFRV